MKVNERELVSVQTLAKRCYNRIAIEIMNGSIFSKELIIRLGQILRNKVKKWLYRRVNSRPRKGINLEHAFGNYVSSCADVAIHAQVSRSHSVYKLRTVFQVIVQTCQFTPWYFKNILDF